MNQHHDGKKKENRPNQAFNSNHLPKSSANEGASQLREFDTKEVSKDWQSSSGQEAFQGQALAKIAELSDLLERADEEIEANSYTRIGDAIHALSERIESLRERRTRIAQRGLKSEVDRSQKLDRKSV